MPSSPCSRLIVSAESTNARVLWFTVLSIGLMVILTVAQVLLLQRSLSKEKLIDSRPLFF